MTALTIPALLVQYAAARDAILETFDVKAEWEDPPLSDETAMHWFVARDKVYMQEMAFTVEGAADGSALYESHVVRDRIYRTGGFCLIHIDTNTDGNEYLAIYSEALECKDEAAIDAVTEAW